MDEFLSISDFAKVVGKSRTWIYDLIEAGTVKVTRIGRKPFIHRGESENIKK